MAKSDVMKIINAYRAGVHGFYIISDCSKSKAYSIKKGIDEILNPEDRFCELKYDADNRSARFEIVS